MRLLIILLATTLCMACSSEGVRNGPLMGTTRFVGDDDIESIIEKDNEHVDFAASDLAIYQVDLINADEEDVVCEVRPRWFGENGIEVKSVTRAWTPVHIAGRSSTPFSSVAPSFEAVRCEVEVRLYQPIEP